MPSDMPVTRLLKAVSRGDTNSEEELWRTVYEELHRLAQAQLRYDNSLRTLSPTALVNEAYLRLIGGDTIQWTDRRHFLNTASRAMRRIRVDYARNRMRAKRGSGERPEPLVGDPVFFDTDPADVLALDEALQSLEEAAPRQAEVITLRFFGGLQVDETAEILGVSRRTVINDWNFAKAWLHRALA